MWPIMQMDNIRVRATRTGTRPHPPNTAPLSLQRVLYGLVTHDGESDRTGHPYRGFAGIRPPA